MAERLIVVRDNQGVRDMLKYLEDKTTAAFDTETNGVIKGSEIIGYSICAESDVAYYVVVAFWDPLHKLIRYEETQTTTTEVMEALKTKSLICHNATFDCSMVKDNYKVSLIESVVVDTMILAHLLDENRRVGLKELGAAFYGDDAKKEQALMKQSVLDNGGVLTKTQYELYKADSELLAKYGAKDTILTWNLAMEMLPQLEAEGLEDFFYQESMPLLRGPTYDMNTTGLKVDVLGLHQLKADLEAEIMSLWDYMNKEVTVHVKDKYPGTKKTNTFNLNSNNHLTWLLFEKLGNEFGRLAPAGQDIAKTIVGKIPYSLTDKKIFISQCKAMQGQVWRAAGAVYDKKARKSKAEAKIKDYWTYLCVDKVVLGKLSSKYKWVAKLLEYKKLDKLLKTYVNGIDSAMRYGVIRPSFLQHGTTSGRYACRAPNFQNLPKDDKRIKRCIVARPGKVFVGADQSQLEARVFASVSQDARLLKSFADGEDFYSVIGAQIFGKVGFSMKKDSKDSFANKFPALRQKAKTVALASAYGTTAFKMAPSLGVSQEEAQEIIDSYFQQFPDVYNMTLEAHKIVKRDGAIKSMFGRPRRIPAALGIEKQYGKASHANLPYEARNLLNLAVNHPIQSAGASIMNRAAIAIWEGIQELKKDDPRWAEVHIVLQVHDSLYLEGPEALKDDMSSLLQGCMENTVTLPGIALIAEPIISTSLAEQK